jgi:hypothetical protein
LNVRPTSTPSGGWIGPGSAISVLEDEYRRAAGKPRLLYVKEPAEVSDGPLETLAQLEHADGEDERAVELLSAADSLRARLHTPLWPPRSHGTSGCWKSFASAWARRPSPLPVSEERQSTRVSYRRWRTHSIGPRASGPKTIASRRWKAAAGSPSAWAGQVGAWMG